MASHGFLNPKAYDRDAEDVDSTFDYDAEKPLDAKSSSETARRHSKDILQEEEETERLIAGHTASRRMGEISGNTYMGGRQYQHLSEEALQQERMSGTIEAEDEKGELLWSMERGEKDDKGNESRSSGSWDTGSYDNDQMWEEKDLSQAPYKSHNVAITLICNGTSLFAPTTILLSIDGFRASFLSLNITPTLQSFIDTGISPLHMHPSFPSLTFPNHYTIATGLYPESHGIVGNTFWDPDLQEEFYYTDPARSMQEKWWKAGEPLWVTAEKQGVRSAVHMWPGSEAGLGGIFVAKYVDKYNGTEVLSKKVDRILGLLDLPGPQDEGAKEDMPRPQLIAAYVPDVDGDGHRYGPNSTEITKTIIRVDDMLSMLFSGLEHRNLTDVVNVVIVSDHGMATTDTSRLIQLEDIVDTDLVSHTDGWPLYGLRPKNAEDLQPMYERLVQEAKKNPNFDVYLRDENMPERYHFRYNPRIAPLWIVPKAGWAIVTKEEFDVEAAKENGAIYHPRGLHGYDHEHPLMRAIFVARGPAFPHTPGSRVEVFQNTEVYNIVCDSLSITPHPNNGTLRLPLKPVGLHSDEGAPVVDVPQDPPEASVNPFIAPVPIFSTLPAVQTNASSGMITSTTGAGKASNVSQITSTQDETPEVMPTRPVVNDDGRGNGDAEKAEKDSATFRAWLAGVLHGAKEWIDELLHKEKGKGTEEAP